MATGLTSRIAHPALSVHTVGVQVFSNRVTIARSVSGSGPAAAGRRVAARCPVRSTPRPLRSARLRALRASGPYPSIRGADGSWMSSSRTLMTSPGETNAAPGVRPQISRSPCCSGCTNAARTPIKQVEFGRVQAGVVHLGNVLQPQRDGHAGQRQTCMRPWRSLAARSGTGCGPGRPRMPAQG